MKTVADLGFWVQTVRVLGFGLKNGTEVKALRLKPFRVSALGSIKTVQVEEV